MLSTPSSLPEGLLKQKKRKGEPFPPALWAGKLLSLSSYFWVGYYPQVLVHIEALGACSAEDVRNFMLFSQLTNADIPGTFFTGRNVIG